MRLDDVAGVFADGEPVEHEFGKHIRAAECERQRLAFEHAAGCGAECGAMHGVADLLFRHAQCFGRGDAVLEQHGQRLRKRQHGLRNDKWPVSGSFSSQASVAARPAAVWRQPKNEITPITMRISAATP